jgi:cytochrome c553
MTPPPSTGTSPNSRGANIATTGIPARQVPACLECHGPDRNPAYPLLAGQPADYLVEQLLLFAEGRRGGSQFAPIMEGIAPRLTPEDMRNAAEHLTSARSTSRR